MRNENPGLRQRASTRRRCFSSPTKTTPSLRRHCCLFPHANLFRAGNGSLPRRPCPPHPFLVLPAPYPSASSFPAQRPRRCSFTQCPRHAENLQRVDMAHHGLVSVEASNRNLVPGAILFEKRDTFLDVRVHGHHDKLCRREGADALTLRLDGFDGLNHLYGGRFAKNEARSFMPIIGPTMIRSH